MATKAKARPKLNKKAAQRSVDNAKSIRLKAKAAKDVVRKAVATSGKAVNGRSSKPTKVESRRTPAAPPPPSNRSTPPERIRSRQFASAVQVYEAGIKAMHAEEFEKAIKCFNRIVDEHSDEPEIQERAKVLLHACEKKIHEKGRTVLRSVDDHYNVGIAELNRRSLDSAIQHLQHALKLAPKADHVLYALAAANALQGNRDQALQHLGHAIQYRPENRFQALRDTDFDSLKEDADFRQLVTSPEK